MNVYLKPGAIKQLDKTPTQLRKLLILKIEALGKNPFPFGSKKLSAREGYRVRIGDYRILYAIEKKRREIIILSVAHRKEAYRKMR